MPDCSATHTYRRIYYSEHTEESAAAPPAAMNTMIGQIEHVPVEGTNSVLEVSYTGVLVECERTGLQMHVLHFRDPASSIAGLSIGPDATSVAEAFKKNQYHPVPMDFQPSRVTADRYMRARLSGQQGIAMTEEVKNDYTLVGVYLNGIGEALSASHKELRDKIHQVTDEPTAAQRKELAELASESERLVELQQACLEARDKLIRDSAAFTAGYHLDEVPEGAPASNTQTENYMLGLYAREQELKKTIQLGFKGPEIANQLSLIEQRFVEIENMSAMLHGMGDNETLHQQHTAAPGLTH